MAVGVQDLYDYLIQQKVQREATTGRPGLTTQEAAGIISGTQAAREAAAVHGEEMRFRREELASKEESEAATARSAAITGTTQLALQAPLTYLAGKKMLAEMGVAGVRTAGAGATVTEPGFGTAAATGGGGKGFLAGAGISSPLTTGGPLSSGPALSQIGNVGWGIYGGAGGAGFLAGTYGQGEKFIPIGGEKERQVAGGALAGAGAGAATGAALTSWSGPGAIVGTVVGAVAGAFGGWMKSRKGKKGGTVICTELYRQGKVPKALLDAEAEHPFPESVYWGYRLWADPVVELMQKSPRFSSFMAKLARPFLKEIAHRVNERHPTNRFGKFILAVGVPLCRWNFKRNAKKEAAKFIDTLVEAGN